MDVRLKGVIWFLLISFGLAWLSWEIPIRLTGIPVYAPEFQPYGLIGGMVPALAAIIVRKWVTGEGFADAHLRLNLRSNLRYYLFAWLFPLAIVGAIVGEAAIAGLASPDLSLKRAMATPDPGAYAALGGAGPMAVPQLMLIAIILTPLLWGEEFGFRGYLQPRLFPGQRLKSAAVTGIIWGVWHYPVILRGYDYVQNPVLGAVLFTITTIALSIIFQWLHERTGSIWSSCLAHAACNSIGALALLWFAGALNPVIASLGGLLAIPPMAAICVWIFWVERGPARVQRRKWSDARSLWLAAARCEMGAAVDCPRPQSFVD